MANAIGIAGYCCIPNTLSKWMTVIPSKMTKYGPAGWAAQAGVTSALLAEMGFTGDTAIFEGDRSFWRFTGNTEWDARRVLENIGREWKQKMTYKHYPAGI